MKTGLARLAVAVVGGGVVLAGLLWCAPWKEREAPVAERASVRTEAADRTLARSATIPPGNIFTNAVGAEMVFIPPGQFLLGSTPEERAWAKTHGAAQEQLETESDQPRRVRIRNGFWIGRTEVTVGQWWQFAKATDYQTDAERGLAVLGSYPEKKPEDHPVAWITWTDALAFCEWLTKMEKQAGRLPAGHVVRLPTEAEWEYACRGGRQGTMFWWGDSPEDGKARLNWRQKDGSVKSVTPVDAFGPRGRNGFGLADMLGNVRELCLDAWDSAGAHAELCTDYVTSKNRVLKGGSFKSHAFDV
ncbi:MAG: formylglycine-generating enzyme family protein, partial [Verrucomicrobia bacterium]|nr:formylglycine-generating enzyme family protein [Verrucomicrobiota bacterium]